MASQDPVHILDLIFVTARCYIDALHFAIPHTWEASLFAQCNQQAAKKPATLKVPMATHEYTKV